MFRYVRVARVAALLIFTLLTSWPAVSANYSVSSTDFPDQGVFIVYGDTRFTNESDHSDANPEARRALVDKIADEHPLAVIMSGDLPFHGGDKHDYEIYFSETKAWQNEHLRVYPVLGNHEFYGASEKHCLDHFWTAFPWMRGRKWYSVQLGNRIYVLNLDTHTSLLPGSEQAVWVDHELSNLPKSIDWVFINLHHPPVSDYDPHLDAAHNVRPNEEGLAEYLKQKAPSIRPQIVVAAGHVHNYERFFRDGVVYLVSGGGGATPRKIKRQPYDLYQSDDFPNYHYVRFEMKADRLQATMMRLRVPQSTPAVWDAKDRFDVPAPAKQAATK